MLVWLLQLIVAGLGRKVMVFIMLRFDVVTVKSHLKSLFLGIDLL